MLEYDRNDKAVELAKTLPTDYEGLIEYIKVNLKCPLPINEGEKFFDLRYHLVELWRRIAKSYSIDDDWYHIYDDEEEFNFQLEEDTEEDLRPMVANISTWIDKAKIDFLAKTKSLTAAIATKATYGKHIPYMQISVAELKALSLRNSASYLDHSITDKVISNIIIKAAEKFFDFFIAGNSFRFSITFDGAIGVSEGKRTNSMMVDLNGVQAEAHAYPCSETEAKNHVHELKIYKKDMIDDSYFPEFNDEDEISIKLHINMSLKEVIR